MGSVSFWLANKISAAQILVVVSGLQGGRELCQRAACPSRSHLSLQYRLGVVTTSTRVAYHSYEASLPAFSAHAGASCKQILKCTSIQRGQLRPAPLSCSAFSQDRVQVGFAGKSLQRATGCKVFSFSTHGFSTLQADYCPCDQGRFTSVL